LRNSQPCCDRIRIIQGLQRRHNPLRLKNGSQRFSDVRTLELSQVRRVLANAVADDPGNGDTDGIELALRMKSQDLIADQMAKALEGMFEQCFVVVGVLRISAQRANQFVIFYEPRDNPRGHDNANGSAHAPSPFSPPPGQAG
jgi:hypothetical protein